ncbi:membrane protein insertase YidC [Helicobacter sp. MIT 99-5507]|uniref:membrane protein insertase YidC n=1 Tax=Helicobacter sp. MIT 99-5507 TaxID=152489 RepID=UPI000E1F311D|nr:membrane protein insertase YidC [Helicobacter sp. MIT 99-5507]RDU56594.1 membrane protein insertase YidC [Helicobacter sp. MIT 99-5507]
MNDNNSNKRFIIAAVLSILFLIPYMYFFSPDTKTKEVINSANKTIEQNNAPAISTTPTIKDETKAPISSSKIIAKIESQKVDIEIDELGRISNIFLKDKKFLNPDGKPLELLSKDSIKPLEMRFSDSEINKKAFDTPYTASTSNLNLDSTSQSITLTQDLGNLVIKKILTFHNNLSYDIKIELSRQVEYFISNGARPIADSSPYVFKGVIVKKNDDKLEKIEDGDSSETLTFNKAKFIASVDRYYTTLFFNKDGFDIITDSTSNGNALPYVILNDNVSFSGYIGPKNYKDLSNISSDLGDVVEYGVITFFAKPLFLLLEWLFDIFSNWGWAIIALTLIVRILLYPLTYKGMVSMQKLKDLSPKLKEIQTKYKGDSQKLQLHMMELYKKHKVNPMGGCLPLLLQIPVFFAIYRVLYNAVELKDSAWLFWIQDLSAMDPYFILPILMGATMYLQQHLSPATFNDPTQEKIFKLLPVFFTIFLITFPAGLILYWTVNNIFSIIQQMIINKVMQNKKAQEIEEHKRSKSDKN